MSDETHIRRLTLTLTDREDGGLRISSADVPGMHLSGADPQRVWSMVAPAIMDLMQRNRGIRVTEVFLPAEEVSTSGPSPREVAAHARCATVMVVLEDS